MTLLSNRSKLQEKLLGERTRLQQEQRKQRHDARHKPSNFEVNDLVLYLLPSTHPEKNKLSPAFEGPYTVTAKLGPETYQLDRDRALKRSSIKAHSSLLRKYFTRDSRFNPTNE